MRCRKHYSDTTSTVGVCSTCLRERLLALIAAQSEADSLPPPSPSPDHPHRRRKPPAPAPPPQHDPHRLPILFPRSVSPYLTFPKSNTDRIDRSHSRTASDPRFFSTPQAKGEEDEKRRKSKFGLISSLFRSRSRKCGHSDLDSDPRVSVTATAVDSSPSSSSSSWISGLVRRGSRRVEKNSTTMTNLFSAAEEKEDKKRTTAESRHHRCRRDRGLSPARDDDDEEEEWEDQSPEYYSPAAKMTPMWKRTPSVKPSQCRVRQSPSRSALAGFGFCLSPLIRVGGPSRSEIGYSGEIRAPVKPSLLTAASFCANRSRKIADFGRLNQNR
ncbi:hypothetical protein Droror1_Dr00005084 [Drosera rotundifolia]